MTMTVEELIARLREFPPDMTVEVRDVDGELVSVDDVDVMQVYLNGVPVERRVYVSGTI